MTLSYSSLKNKDMILISENQIYSVYLLPDSRRRLYLRKNYKRSTNLIPASLKRVSRVLNQSEDELINIIRNKING